MSGALAFEVVVPFFKGRGFWPSYPYRSIGEGMQTMVSKRS
jgi:hypothetical protein